MVWAVFWDHILKTSPNSKSQNFQNFQRVRMKQELIWAHFISSASSLLNLAKSPLAKPSCHLGLVAGLSSCHEALQVQQKMGKAQQSKRGSAEVTGWVGKQISSTLHKALTMKNVFLIICSLLETCRSQSLRHSLAATGVILAIIVQLDLLLSWIHYRPFKDRVCSYSTLYHWERGYLWQFLL